MDWEELSFELYEQKLRTEVYDNLLNFVYDQKVEISLVVGYIPLWLEFSKECLAPYHGNVGNCEKVNEKYKICSYVFDFSKVSPIAWVNDVIDFLSKIPEFAFEKPSLSFLLFTSINVDYIFSYFHNELHISINGQIKGPLLHPEQEKDFYPTLYDPDYFFPGFFGKIYGQFLNFKLEYKNS